jgi:23S rRNA pseudouridine2605 synthase
MPPASHGLRLQRVLASAGVAPRRTCEAMIQAGRIRVNGQIVRHLPVFVDPERDRIEADGKPVPTPTRHIYLMLNKPERVLSTTTDEPGKDRRTILDLVDHPAKSRLFPVGRLDFHAAGLILLTSDGPLANRLSHPRYAVPRTYEVLVRGTVAPETIKTIERILTPARRDQLHGRPTVEVVKRTEGRTLLRLTTREGRRAELRDLLARIGLPVKRLVRTAIGPLILDRVAIGRWRELTRDEVRLLRQTVSNTPERPRGRSPNKPSERRSEP